MEHQQKIEKTKLANKQNYIYLKLCFYDIDINFQKKIQLSDIKATINDKKNLNSNNDFIKMCKGIYKFTYGLSPYDQESSDLCANCLNQFMRSVDQWVEFEQKQYLNEVLNNIQKIQCDDEEFKQFKQTLEDYVFDVESKQFKVKNNDKFEVKSNDENDEFEVYNSDNEINNSDEL